VTEPESDEIDIMLRPATIVGRRMVVLATLCRRAFLESKQASSELDDDPEGDRFDLRMWLHDHQLDDELIAEEVHVLETNAGDLSADDATALSWNSEALAALAWAVELAPALPDPAQTVDPTNLLATIPAPWDDPRAWISSVMLREEFEIASERERAEVWAWRAEVEDKRRQLPGQARRALEADIAEVVREATAAGLLPKSTINDFVSGGRPVRELSDDQLDTLLANATIRLHALNWLCGFGTDWDDVPLEID